MQQILKGKNILVLILTLGAGQNQYDEIGSLPSHGPLPNICSIFINNVVC